LFALLYTFTYTVLPSPVSCVVCPSLHISIYSSPFSSIMCRLPLFTHLHIQFSLIQYHVSFARLSTFAYTVLPSLVSCVICPSLHIYITYTVLSTRVPCVFCPSIVKIYRSDLVFVCFLQE
jgi:hypothetical protein